MWLFGKENDWFPRSRKNTSRLGSQKERIINDDEVYRDPSDCIHWRCGLCLGAINTKIINEFEVTRDLTVVDMFCEWYIGNDLDELSLMLALDGSIPTEQQDDI